MDIPGISVIHCVIGDSCREMHGDEGALDEAFSRIRQQYNDIMKFRADEPGVNYRVVMMVEDTKQGMKRDG